MNFVSTQKVVKEDLRSKILDAAIELLEREGPKAFGQTRVAREAGVQQGHLTYYYPKKSDLVAGVLERLSERARVEIERLVARSARLGEAERHDLFFAQIQAVMTDKKRTRILLGLIIEAQQDDELAALLAERAMGPRMVIAALMGRLPTDLDVEIALATLRGIGLQNLLARDSRHSDAMVARFRQWLGALPPQ
jgi:AcrR family transcriptional regulator